MIDTKPEVKANPVMKLVLNDHTFPYFFSADDTTWFWNEDKTKLTITVSDDPLSFLSHHEVFEVDAKRILEWDCPTL